jgi:hypothetical protein
MTPIADRLQEYTSIVLNACLSQFDEEPEIAPNLKRNAYLDRQLARSGIVSSSPIKLPASITPELLNTLLTQGDEPMTTQAPLTRVRIHTHFTKKNGHIHFLHMEDALSIGKVRLFAGHHYAGQKIHVQHYIDLADARVIFGALAGGEQGFRHKEYKGTPPKNGQKAVSRVLSVAVKGGNVYIELKTGPGKLTNTGAITPNGPAKVEVNVGFNLYAACRMAASVLAYIHAWDVMRMLSNREMVSQPAPYLLVSATSEANSAKTTPANGVSKPNGATKPPVVAANNGRPVTRKTAQPATAAKPSPATNSLPPRRRGGRSQNGHTKQNGHNVQPQGLLYGDGTPVVAGNQTEHATYIRYQEVKGVAPPSKSALQQFYQQQVAT